MSCFVVVNVFSNILWYKTHYVIKSANVMFMFNLNNWDLMAVRLSCVWGRARALVTLYNLNTRPDPLNKLSRAVSCDQSPQPRFMITSRQRVFLKTPSCPHQPLYTGLIDVRSKIWWSPNYMRTGNLSTKIIISLSSSLSSFPDI